MRTGRGRFAVAQFFLALRPLNTPVRYRIETNAALSLLSWKLAVQNRRSALNMLESMNPTEARRFWTDRSDCFG
jgi:hypothetical protein